MRHPIVENNLLRGQQGVTLVELIISMVIISIALGGVLLVMNFTTSHSADPMIQYQAVAIAEAYMEEILLQGYKNPTGGYTGSERKNFDDVDDYDVINAQNPPQKRDGTDIDELKGYSVSVVVDPPADFGPSGNPVKAKKITVQVKRGTEVDLTLVGYRTKYN